MGKVKLFDLSTTSPRERLFVVAGSLAFLLFQWLVVGLIPAQVLMVAIFNTLFFAHALTRKLAMALLPFVLFEISYDWMRLYPNYRVNPIDIQGIYEAEKALFGFVNDEGQRLIACEYFYDHHWPLADFLAGLFYLCWVPGPIAVAVWLFFSGKRACCLRFTWAFLFVNLVGFAGYYIHPTAPPWYAIEFGYEPDFTVPGHVAGLGRFDDIVGYPVFTDIYVNNSNIFAAIPSLHAAYMLVATIYAVIGRLPKAAIAGCMLITAGIWWTAVYTCHHYIIDVLLGIATGFLGVFLYEKVVQRLPAVRHFFDQYTVYIR